MTNNDTATTVTKSATRTKSAGAKQLRGKQQNAPVKIPKVLADAGFSVNQNGIYKFGRTTLALPVIRALAKWAPQVLESGAVKSRMAH